MAYPNNNNNNPNRSFKNFNNQNQQAEDHRINFKIRCPEVRLIGDDGEQLGIMPTNDARKIAEDKGLDLVEVAPNAKPPVCKIMDYGKFKYREQKKEMAAKKKRTETETKELRIRYRTDKGDLQTKLKQARSFIENGDKVKFSMRFKGREAMYINVGVQKLNEITEALSDIAIIDEQSKPQGNNIYVVYAPDKSKKIATNKDKVEVKQKNQETDKKEMVKEETISNTPNSVVAE
ncbi:MAG: translation initiation factor IF-3 [Bdellovibrionota bacterium]|nr:translation initiation factor IF-3 [Bdellovibrionota bacterium]